MFTAVRFVVSLAPVLLAGCIRFSPYSVSLPDEMTDQTAKNLQTLAARPRPPASAAEPLKFVLVSDTHEAYPEFSAIVDYVNAHKEIEFVVHAGDIVNYGAQQEYRWAHEVYSRLRVPFFAVAGNHDGLSNGKLLYEDMFGPDNFIFEHAGVRFIFFNTNTIEWGLPEPDFNWLAGQLGSAGGKKTVVVSHHPPISEPHLTREQSAKYLAVMRDGGLDAYLYGHLHADFGASKVDGTDFIKVRTAREGAFYVVTTDGEQFTLESCVGDKCEPAAPVEAPGVRL